MGFIKVLVGFGLGVLVGAVLTEKGSIPPIGRKIRTATGNATFMDCIHNAVEQVQETEVK